MRHKTNLWITIFIYGFVANLFFEMTEESVFWSALGVLALAIIAAIIAMQFGKEEDGSSNPEQP